MACGCMKGRSRRGLGSLAGHPSKVKLAEALRELGYEKAVKGSANCEAYGRKVFCYPCFVSFAQRREAEAKLEAHGFKVNKRYGELGSMRRPGEPLNSYPCAEVAVSYFKAWHWDE
jgi:hypothetical protein